MSERSIGGKPPLNSRPAGRKNRALQVPPVVPYKALEKFSKALYGATGGAMLIIIRVISGGTLNVLLGTLFLLPMDRLLV